MRVPMFKNRWIILERDSQIYPIVRGIHATDPELDVASNPSITTSKSVPSD